MPADDDELTPRDDTARAPVDHRDDHEADDPLEPDVFADAAQDVAAAAARRRIGTAPALLLGGGAAWAVAMVLRCSPLTPPDDRLTVPTGDPSAHAGQEASSRTPKGDAPSPTEAAPTGKPAPQPPSEAPPSPAPHVELSTEPAAWAKGLRAPELVHYTVRHGGSIKNVANLFKIYHHEIVALNPSHALEAELSPGTPVLVYRRGEGERSESVGVASDGSLVGGVPMLDGPGRVLKMIPWKGWGTAHTVATLDAVLRQWAADETNTQPILVGNMSARNGGRLAPHSTHQSGRDVDLGYPQKLPRGEELNWREMSADNLDPAATWKLLALLQATGQLEVVFIDATIQKLLHQWAVGDGGMSKASLRRWMEYPRPTAGDALIQHVPGHVDHLHARFVCQPHEPRCRSKTR